MVEYFPALAALPGLHHAISTRHGGVSEGAYATLNLGYHVGDDPACVTENRRRFGALAGYDAAKLICAQQVHGTGVAWVGAAECGRGAFAWEDALPGTDGLLVREAGVPVAILVADCAPVLLVDPVQRMLAVVHAGWRGAFGRIVSAAVREMLFTGARPEDLWAGIGPALCTDCLEVGAEVGERVMGVFGPAVLRTGAEKPHLDLRAMIEADLRAAGVPEAQITAHPLCTRCHTDRFFSHRGQQGRAGRFALVAWWD